MSIIKNEIVYTGKDINMKFSLDSINNNMGQQQSLIDSVTTYTTESVNPIIDIEARRFKYDVNLPPTTLSFYFNRSGFYTNSFSTGFTNTMTLNSFFILDFYDSFDTYSQNKIFRTYLTKIGNVPQYNINDSNIQFNVWYIPQSHLKSLSNISTGYTKFSFYDASTGVISAFYNYNNRNLVTNEKMFFKTELNAVNKSWRMITDSFPSIIAYEFPNNNNIYSDRINNTINTVPVNKPNYPSKFIFDYKTQTYVDIVI